jgi:L-threonylcarbamoyladenylate synthase
VSPTTALHVAEDLGNRVAMIVDGGPCDVGIESTIVAFTGDAPVLLRPGGIPVEALTRVLGMAPREPGADAPRASGTLASHYAPRTQSHLVPPHALVAEWRQHAERDEQVAVLARTVEPPEDFEGAWISAPATVEGYARHLYAALRELDHAGVDALLIEAVPDDDAWLAVRDRLERATHPVK